MSPHDLTADPTVCGVEHGDNAAKVIVAAAKNEGIDLILMAGRPKTLPRRTGQAAWIAALVRTSRDAQHQARPGTEYLAVDALLRRPPVVRAGARPAREMLTRGGACGGRPGAKLDATLGVRGTIGSPPDARRGRRGNDDSEKGKHLS